MTGQDNKKRDNYKGQNNMNGNYNQGSSGADKNSINKKILIGIIALALIAAAIAYKATSHEDLYATILSVEPNYKTIQVENKDCHNVNSHVQVKNPERTFWNGMFNSSKYPKYLTKDTSHVVCHESYSESQALQYYTVQYKIKSAVNTIIVRDNPPAVNTEIPLSQLQSYMESSSVTVGVLGKESE